jgi:mRNA interferase RelE/StbE
MRNSHRSPARRLWKQKGLENPVFYSPRVGGCRAILSIIDDLPVVHVIAIGPRSGACQRF